MRTRLGALVLLGMTIACMAFEIDGAGGQGGRKGEGSDSPPRKDQAQAQPAPESPADARGGGAAQGEDLPVYRPPIRCAPAGRLAAGTRGPDDALPDVAFLGPGHVGLSLSDQPVLYWFLSRTSEAPVELTVIAAEAIHPLLEIRLAPPVSPGIHPLHLSRHGIRLKAGVTYRCFVALIQDPDRRSRDIMADGFIQLAECQRSVQARLDEAEPRRKPFILAEEGLWYDALQAIMELINADPHDAAARRQRAALLRQVGLREAAEYDD
jgi:hypothetical protein